MRENIKKIFDFIYREVNFEDEEVEPLTEEEEEELDELLRLEFTNLTERKANRSLNGTEIVELEMIQDEFTKKQLKAKKERTVEENTQIDNIIRGQNKFFSYIYKNELYKDAKIELVNAVKLYETKLNLFRETCREFEQKEFNIFDKSGFDARDLFDYADIISSLTYADFSEEKQKKFKEHNMSVLKRIANYTSKEIEGTPEEKEKYKNERKEAFKPILDVYYKFIMGNGYKVCNLLAPNFDFSKISDEKIFYTLIVVQTARQAFDTKLLKENMDYIYDKCKTYQELREFYRRTLLVQDCAALVSEEIFKCGLGNHFVSTNNEFNTEVKAYNIENRKHYITEINFLKSGNITLDVDSDVLDLADIELDNNLARNIEDNISINNVLKGLCYDCSYILDKNILGTLVFVNGRSLTELAREAGYSDDNPQQKNAIEVILAKAIKDGNKPIEFVYPTSYKNEIKFEVKPLNLKYNKKDYINSYDGFFARVGAWFRNPTSRYASKLRKSEANKAIRHNNIISYVQNNFDTIRDKNKGDIVFNQDIDKKYSKVENKENKIIKEVENKNVINKDNIINPEIEINKDNVIKKD